jgi:hypothetical protein
MGSRGLLSVRHIVTSLASIATGLLVDRVTTPGVAFFTALFVAHVGFRIDPRVTVAIGLQVLAASALRLVAKDTDGADALARVSYGLLATGILAEVIDLPRSRARPFLGGSEDLL